MREEGRPFWNRQLARGQEWGGGCSLIGIKVVVSRGQGEEDERQRGGRGPEEVQRAEGVGPHLEKARFRRALEHTLAAGLDGQETDSSSLDTRPR